MSEKITSRDDLRFVGNISSKEFHDLTNEKRVCRIDEIIESGNAVSFKWDSRVQALSEDFVICYHCLGNQPVGL